jgi:hypothetical protein
MRSSTLWVTAFLSGSLLWGQSQPKPNGAAAASDSKPAQAAESNESRKRVELNLLGKEDANAGESRRNENIQFNLVDNNALKELNVRLGATATLVGEFQDGRSYYGAEFGNAPSAVLRVTPAVRAGWHGKLFEIHQNSIFSARSFFQVGDVKPAHENRYGAAVGGSPWRGGYVSFDGAQDRIRGQVNGNVLVPTHAERTIVTTDPRKRALIQKFLNAYPDELPNRTDINARMLNTNAPQSVDTNDATMRLEQDLGSRGRLLTSYRFLSQSVEAFQLVAGQNPDTDTRSHTARATWIKSWSPATTTSFSAGFDRIGSLLVPDESAVGPMVSVSGWTTLGPSAIIPIDRAQNLFRYEGMLRTLRSRHELSAGFFVTRRQFNGVETDAHRGYFGFSNDFGRTGIQNLLLGTPSTYLVSIGNVRRGFRQWLPLVYLGDNWHATANLTLHFTMRYEPVSRPVEVNNLNQVPYNCDCNNIAPRAGFAYRLPQNWGALRGGFGIDYGDIFPVTYSQVRFSPPLSEKLTISAPDLLDPLSSLKQTGETADALPNLYLLDPKLRSPYSYQYNFGWEPSISKNWRLQLGYIGSRSHKLLTMWYMNRAHAVEGIPQTTATINQRRANPNYAEIRWVLNGSQGYFDAARVTLVAPRVHGFTVDTAYWFSKAMDLGADYTNTAYDADSRVARSQSEYNYQSDRKALSSFDQPHSFLTRVSYETPAHNGQGWAARLTRNWIASGVVLLKKGTPFSVTTFDGPGYGNVDNNGNDRPNLVDTSILGRTIGNPDTSVSLLPKSAFSFMKPTDEAGNLGANTFRKGGIHNVNASLARHWTLHSDVRLTLRAESINLTNTPQFAEPGSTLGSPEFGTITNTLNDGRTFRFGLTVLW